MNDPKHPAGHVLQAYHDGELDPPATAEVAAHCDHCKACQAELAELEQVGRILAGTPVPELSRPVWPRVRPGRGSESRLKPAFGLAACAAGIVLGVLLGPIRFSPEETGTDTAWSETVTVWDGSATSSLLSVYETKQE